MNRDWCGTVEGGIRLAVQIMPNAKKSEVSGLFDDVLKIRLQAQPIDGKANEVLVHYLAKLLDVPKSAVFLTHGHTGRRKIIEVRASRLTVEMVRKLLLPSVNG
jgi:uncharacterized protein (TIGR00251 family)